MCRNGHHPSYKTARVDNRHIREQSVFGAFVDDDGFEPSGWIEPYDATCQGGMIDFVSKFEQPLESFMCRKKLMIPAIFNPQDLDLSSEASVFPFRTEKGKIVLPEIFNNFSGFLGKFLERSCYFNNQTFCGAPGYSASRIGGDQINGNAPEN